jgi:hypothetical protein
MKLTRTEPLGGSAPTAAVSSAPIKAAQFEDDEDDEDNEGALNGMSIVALVGAIAALFIALLGFAKVTPFTHPDIAKAKGKEWASDTANDWKIPAKYNPFAKESADETFTSTYNDQKKNDHALPIRPEATNN